MSNNKHEWKKEERQFYGPKTRPEIVTLPGLKFFILSGKGNPNDSFFGEYISVLYSLSYAVKMSSKSGFIPEGFFDYTVYPLEGLWNLSEAARKDYNGTFNKNDLIFEIMIRQPDFVTEEFAAQIIRRTEVKKPHKLLNKVRFETFAEGKCVQMLHIGSYDTEPASFKIMEEFAKENNIKRKAMNHREIYLSDARKTAPDKLKTILRFQVDESKKFSN